MKQGPMLAPSRHHGTRSWLDRALSVFTDVRPGEGATAILMLSNIFVLLICYSVIKTVREPLILLGGGAEVRSYAAAAQAVLLMGFVPLYSLAVARVGRGRLLVGVTLFFIACIELFALATHARVPYVGVAFFIWVGVLNVSLIAQFWSFANDIYRQDAGERLFPIIVIGMTAGAPLGSYIAGHLFGAGVSPTRILHISAALLGVSALLYLTINRRQEHRTAGAPASRSSAGGFSLVLGNRYLRLVAALIVLLNVVNTTGEYVMARLMTNHAAELAAVDPAFDAQAYLGALAGEYQFWVNIVAFVLQAFISSRLVKHQGLRGALLALPLVALGGYAIVAAGAGLSMVRWVKTAENATDYSIMNTARQLLWLPTTREEKYKAKQAIDTFFVRAGDVLSALAVYAGAQVLHLTIEQFAIGNVVLTLAWIGVALLILSPRATFPRLALRPAMTTAAAVAILVAGAPAAFAQETRAAEHAAQQAAKADRLHPYEPTPLERKIERAARIRDMFAAPVYPFIGSAFDGGGLAVGPGYRARFRDTGTLDAHAAWSMKGYRSAVGILRLPDLAAHRVTLDLHASWLDAPRVAFFGAGSGSLESDRTDLFYKTTTVGVSGQVRIWRRLAAGGALDALHVESGPAASRAALDIVDASYRRAHLFAEMDSRTSPGYTTRGGLYRLDWFDYRQAGAGPYSFSRLDAEVRQFVPLLRENWVIALRALASTTSTTAGRTVPSMLLPDLGGSHALRGYPTWRFRDRNRLLFSGEYRWAAGHFLDMALFMDAGKVAPRAEDLDFRGLRKTYGLGLSFHTPTRSVMRVEIARTREGKAAIFSFSPSF